MPPLWTVDHYEQNEDHPELNDHAQWFARESEGKTYVGFLADWEPAEVEVEGDVQAAKDLVPGKVECWPSYWLGPQDVSDWDYCLGVLKLRRVGDPRPVTTDTVYN